MSVTVRATGGRSLAVLAVLALGIGGCQSGRVSRPVAATQTPWSYRGADGLHLTTDHFDIYSTLRDKELEAALPMYVEAAYRQYAELLPPPAGDHGRLATYVFNDRRQWEQFARDRFPQRFPVYQRISAGGFAEGSQCVVYYIQRPYTLSVLAHEGMHQYFANYFSTPLPAWLNEGMATYCESFELPGGVPRFTPRRNTFRMNALREGLSTGSVLPLQQMLATDAGQVLWQGKSRLTKTYYAQAWALTVYLKHGAGGRWAGGFNRLLQDVTSGVLPTIAQAAKIRAPSPARTSYGEAVFRAYITEDLAEFERGFEAYLHELAGFRAPQG